MNSDVANFQGWVAARWAKARPGRRTQSDVPYDLVAALGLAGETGEVVELLKKHLRDGKHPGFDLLLELGDVLHYLTVIAHAYNYSLGDVMRANVEKLNDRDTKRRGLDFHP